MAKNNDFYWDSLQDKISGHILTRYAGFWNLVNRSGYVGNVVNAYLINGDIKKVKFRPYALSTMSEYTSWESLSDRTYSGRHLPPAAWQKDELPPVEKVVSLFARPPGKMKPSSKSTVLFPYFAQWFTDGFLRTDYHDGRKNTSNHELDLSNLYGLTPKMANCLRSGVDGKLKSQIINNEEYPPYYYDANGKPKAEFADLEWAYLLARFTPIMKRDPLDQQMFAVGGDRVNSQAGFSAMNTLFLREHNRICDILKKKQTHWGDDRLFHTARIILIVILTKIVVEEYINHIAPYNFKFRLAAGAFETQRWYRQNWMAVEFNLLYRWHGLVPDTYKINGKDVPLWDTLFNNRVLTDRGLGGLLQDASQQTAGEIGLFNVPHELLWVETLGVELGRFNQLAGYNDYRELCRFPRVTSFEQITTDKQVQEGLKDVYGHVDKIEYYPGIFAEEVRGNSAVANLIGRLVGIDAFSQALTNPLLSANIYHDQTFTREGMEIIDSSKTLEDIVNRNVPSGSPHYSLTMDLPRR